ncbi:glutathione S-transferase [Xylariaceae sp. FL0662B]|nr:glutathione S-transferase [Xylariaceae sp. FL0662B]
MAPFGKIYSYPNNFRVTRAQVVAAINGLEVPLVEDFTMGTTNKTPDFLAKFPMGKVPGLECADGFCLAEGAAIARYLASVGPAAPQLLGSDPKTQARIAEWAHFSEGELAANLSPPVLMALMKAIPFDEQRYNTALANIDRALKRIEVAVQGGKKYLVGEQLTLADVMVAGPLFLAFKLFADAEMRKGAPGVVAWIQGIAEIPEFKKFFGNLELCETRRKA